MTFEERLAQLETLQANLRNKVTNYMSPKVCKETASPGLILAGVAQLNEAIIKIIHAEAGWRDCGKAQ